MPKKIYCTILCCLLTFLPSILQAQAEKEKISASIEAQQDAYRDLALDIWNYAEIGYKETKSSQALQQTLESAGFNIERGVAEIPTAFVASYGSGEPVIGILGEYDALPGLSQAAVAERKTLVEGAAGHACGHHLFGVASAAAAIAMKDWLDNNDKSGTVRFYGTPAEEGGSGKVYMVRAGLFDDVDVVLQWHPSSVNDASPGTTLANKSGKFRFYGEASHAAFAPERGRSALDGVEAMNYMVNMMREHTEESSRIHYVITKGGEAPNVVPNFAEVYYYVRHKDVAEVKDMWNRLINAAEGAAQGTDTRVEVEVVGGVYNILPNETLSEVMYENLQFVGGVDYDAKEKAFAEKISATFGNNAVDLSIANEIQPRQMREGKASSDVGDVSWAVPTVGLGTATWVPGTSAHSWQAVAAGGTSIGIKGMIVAAKTIALSGIELIQKPNIIDEARQEFDQRRGEGFQYEALIGEREPPLDYRK
ncbi:aminobenzoyl-glutamate utilization protein B [Catalinimonas alkaloidigena]|uniref:amidohydrolase n=1 Tax=Catalinimonas alkaloidigena TaxID=1075417 RepID=UPI00240736C0|nr:amidohydrolase [Catalinimonas alkaloidigena]MDF9798203.1 aminobenzoyl-glutamate utilization protein B [Catalinimonas alkaloidigena]